MTTTGSGGRILVAMDASIARAIAHAAHRQQRNRGGHLVTEHVERVAATVPLDARALAYLHDIVERTDVSYERLRAEGLTHDEAEALELVTKMDGESYAPTPCASHMRQASPGAWHAP